jgi:AraC-like DNA-binding protein
LSIGEIAGRTGYRTSANMIRAFKRAEGVTPGQLAAQSRQTGEEHTD